MKPTAPNAIVLFGGTHQFLRNQQVLQSKVQSRMLIRCLAGCGQLKINRETVELSPGIFVWMPWNRRLEYRADPHNPMMICGAHIVPDFDSAGEPVEFLISHFPGDRHMDSLHRRDCVIEGLEGVVTGTFKKGDGLDLIGNYISEWMWHRERTEETARALAQLLIAELDRSVNSRIGLPGIIHHTRAYVRHHQGEKITLKKMADNAGCSISTLTREFNKHCGCSPMQWVLRFKMEQAADLLRTTGLRACEAGERVGISDPYYFSRLFKKTMGQTPSEYRKEHALF